MIQLLDHGHLLWERDRIPTDSRIFFINGEPESLCPALNQSWDCYMLGSPFFLGYRQADLRALGRATSLMEHL